MVFQTKTYASLVSALPKSISDKRAAKKRKSLAKIVYLNVGTTCRNTFPSSELQCWPRGDPRNLCVNTRIQLLATHSLEPTRYIQNPSMVTHDTIALLNDYHIFIINIRCTRN